MRERILKCFEQIIGYVPKEDEQFDLLCDYYDFIDVVMNCEKEFNIAIDSDLKDEFDFDEVKHFVDWVSECVAKQTGDIFLI